MAAMVKRNGDFQKCTMCGRSWHDLNEFVTDPYLRVEGYQACFVRPELGLVLVTHREDGCGTTLAVQATRLRVLYDGPEYTAPRTGADECLGHCLDPREIEHCEADCEMAWVRSVLQCLRNHRLPPHMR